MQTAVIQARVSSQRLPGKVLLEVGGIPLLKYLVDRLRRAKQLDFIVLATSDEPSDDSVAALGRDLGLVVIRGPLNDVLGRFLLVSQQLELKSLVRVSGDSPLLDPTLVDVAASMFEAGGSDLVTNVFPRTFPKGQSVEVVAVEALCQAAELITDWEDREHVTRCLYRHPERFRIRNLEHDQNLSEMQLSVDTAEDFNLFGAMVARMTRPHWEYGVEELIRLHRTTAPI